MYLLHGECPAVLEAITDQGASSDVLQGTVHAADHVLQQCRI